MDSGTTWHAEARSGTTWQLEGRNRGWLPGEPRNSYSTVVIPAEFEAGGTIRGRELVCRE